MALETDEMSPFCSSTILLFDYSALRLFCSWTTPPRASLVPAMQAVLASQRRSDRTFLASRYSATVTRRPCCANSNQNLDLIAVIVQERLEAFFHHIIQRDSLGDHVIWHDRTGRKRSNDRMEVVVVVCLKRSVAIVTAGPGRRRDLLEWPCIWIL